jgi:hypothetical protein
MHVLSERERKAMETLKLRQPAASYNPEVKNAQIPWSQSLVTKYQDKFLKGANLNRAWQEIPSSVLVGLLEQVRTRVLRFALDMKDEIGEADDVEMLPAPVVERSVVQNFYGDNVVIAEHAGNISILNAIHVEHGNLHQLENALESLGLEKRSIEDMKKALAEDSADGRPTLGQKTLKWATDGATYLANEGLKVGVEVAKAEVRRWLMQYTGWSGF